MNIIISNTGDKPIYEQITSQIKNLIIKGEAKPGDPLPSMRLLAKELRISVITTKRAYNDLEQEGFIRTIPGKGSFISSQNTELIRESTLREAEEYLQKAADLAKASGITLETITDILTLLYEGE